MSGLVRMSDFCSSSSSSSPRRNRRRGRARRPCPSPTDDDEGDEAVEEEAEGRRPGAVPVAVSILSSAPSTAAATARIARAGCCPEPNPQQQRRCRRRRRQTPTRPLLDDPYATVYATDPSLLLELGAFEGTAVCSLSSSSPSSLRWSAPCLVRIVPPSALTEEEEEDDDDHLDGRTDTTAGADPPEDGSSSKHGTSGIHRVYVPPCLAATAGLYEFAPSTLRRAYLRRTTALPSVEGLTFASKAVVAEVAAPPPPVFSSCDAFNFCIDGEGADGDQEEEEEDGDHNEEEEEEERRIRSLRKYFFATKKEKKKIRKKESDDYKGGGGGAARGEVLAAPRLMGVGTIFAVPDRDNENNDDDEVGVRFYEVISMLGEGGVSSPSSAAAARVDSAVDSYYEKQSKDGRLSFGEGGEGCGCYLVSPRTELVLHDGEGGSSPSGPPRRLPGISKTVGFNASVVAAASAAEQRRRRPRRREQPSLLHPTVSAVMDALLPPPPPSSSSFPSVGDSVISVVGSPDDHACECIDAAADALGMRAVHVDGLAAFDYRYRLYRSSARGAQQRRGRQPSSSPSPPAPPSTTVTGSLGEKLSGLRCALDEARRSAPCVLLCSVDGELTSHDVDADARTDEENRIVALLTEAIVGSGDGGEIGTGDPATTAIGDGFLAPPLLVVLSSAKPLPAGPLASLPNREAVRVSHPDEAYARQLWGRNDDDGDDARCLPPFDEVRAHLLGRTANEIELARHRFAVRRWCRGWDGAPVDDDESAGDALASILKELDDGPCVVSGGSASKLSSSLIPNVRWEDVGGLSHVRDEVMDAIELPLRHPGLFAGSGGRSGILLFGPPGTGKTLVAKAVATECGLPFLSVKGPELLGSYVGESEANVRAAFASAREAAGATAGREGGGGAILFFDELDSLAPRRGGVGDGGGVMERVVATLLGELDKDGPNERDGCVARPLTEACRVFVIGATNRPDLLDPSLLRPGRFDRLVYLGLAQTREDRIKILAAQTRKFRFDHGQDAISVLSQVIDSIPPSMSGADLSAIAKGSLMRSLKRLCEEAEEEVLHLNEANRSDGTNVPSKLVDVDDMIAAWDKDRLVPIVKAEDFVVAARDMTPSVSDKELENYESLKAHFCA